LNSRSELQEFADSFNDMADTIVRNMDQLRKSDKNRRDLAANISHDLRTPLTIIRGYAETIQLKDERLSAGERQKYLEIMLNSIDRMLKMVNELFELSNLDARDSTPEMEQFSLTELLQDIKQKNMIKAEEKNISMVLECSDQVLPVYADIQMMEKAFQNLIDNALNYTGPGGKIHISFCMKDEHHIRLKISDSGIGIEEEKLPRIFDRYYRIKTKEGEQKGTGLGLAIVKKILDLHGFKIGVRSIPGKGTDFFITIPVESGYDELKGTASVQNTEF
jgi:signal transduction histidine kinase